MKIQMKLQDWLIFTVIGISIVISSSWTVAGEKGGNGGDAAVCYGNDGEILWVRLYDLFEAADKGIYVHPNFQGLSRRQHLNEIFSYISTYDPQRANRYSKLAFAILNEIELLESNLNASTQLVKFTNNVLPDVPDTGPVISPDCKVGRVEQLIIRNTERHFRVDKEYTIRYPLFSRMSSTHQVAAIAHEVVYSESVDREKHVNSIHSRYFNSRLHALDVTDLTSYLDLLRDSKKIYDAWSSE